jgi:hypothetical protein
MVLLPAGGGGTNTVGGATIAIASPSLIAVIVEPWSTMPPFATPTETGRACATELTTVPVAALRSARSAITAALPIGDARLLKRPDSLAGIVTTMRPARSSTVESGIRRTRSPLRVPTARPDPSTTTALLDCAKSNASLAISIVLAEVGAEFSTTVVP